MTGTENESCRVGQLPEPVTLEAHPEAAHYPYKSTPNVWIEYRHGVYHWRCTRCSIGGGGFDTESAASDDYAAHQLAEYRKETGQ